MSRSVENEADLSSDNYDDDCDDNSNDDRDDNGDDFDEVARASVVVTNYAGFIAP